MWVVLMKATYLIIPFAVILLGILVVMWMGTQCLQGSKHSFFWFLAVCLVAFLVPVLLWTTQEESFVHPGLRFLVSLGMLLFAFWPRGDSTREDDDDFDEDDEDDFDDDEDEDVVYAHAADPVVHTAVLEDDLTKIEGIGPAIQKLCYAAGVMTYGQLADASLDHLQTMLEKAGDRFKMHDPFTWSDQAAMARDGQREQLDRFQELLDGGRAR